MAVNETGNRVWIELDKPKDKEHAEKQCRLANNMLKRLCVKPEDMTSKFFYSEHSRTYCFGGDYGYIELPDHGHWFNLDSLGRE